jgi:hypothetical protein
MAQVPDSIRNSLVGKKPTPNLASHRHPESLKNSRWMMGRQDGVIGGGTGSLLQWWVNPSECQWKVATRTSIEKIPGGAIHHEWPQTGHYANSSFKGSRFDQPYLSMSFQAGIVTPGGYDDIWNDRAPTDPNALKKPPLAPISTDIPSGLGNFYDFLSLIEAPDITSSGEPNYINILYASPIFGRSGISLQGFFTEDGVSWTDTAENPNTITAWGATFVVFNCKPALKELRHCFMAIGINT